MANENPTQATVKGRYIGGPIFEPREVDGKERYQAIVILDDGEAVKVEAAVAAAIKEKWPNKTPDDLVIWGVQVGDRKKYETTYGKQFVAPKASEKVPPKVLVKRNGAFEPTSRKENIIYPGCDVYVSVNAYGYDERKTSPAGVTLGLRAILFRGDNEPLVDMVNPDDEFADTDDVADVSAKDEFFGE